DLFVAFPTQVKTDEPIVVLVVRAIIFEVEWPPCAFADSREPRRLRATPGVFFDLIELLFDGRSDRLPPSSKRDLRQVATRHCEKEVFRVEVSVLGRVHEWTLVIRDHIFVPSRQVVT